MTGATATMPQTAAKPADNGKPRISLDDVMSATEDMRAVLGKRWGIPPSRVFAYGETFISLAKNCPDGFRVPGEIIAQFLQLAAEHNLNPARYEIRAFFDYIKGLSTFVMIDGWLTLANRQPAFDGFDFEYERDSQGALIAVTCAIHRKDRSRPTKTRCKLSEWRVSTSPQWGSKPEWMLEQKALKQGIRRTFGFAGIIDDDDARQMGLEVPETPVKTAPAVTLDQLAPAAPPPVDEYTRKAPAPMQADDTAQNEPEAKPEPKEDAKSEARKKLEAPAERQAPAAVPAKEAKPTPEPVNKDEIAPDVLTRKEKVFVRMLGSKRVTATVADMNETDLRDARDAAEATLHDPAASDADRSRAAGVIVLLEDEAARRVKA